MQQYPSIEGSSKAPLGVPCIAFYKYDGSNLRWEWNPKKGWFKFGTRTQLFDASHEVFGKAIPIFLNGMADEVLRRVKDFDRNVQRITAFTEYFGPNSFAGQHVATDEMELRLIDTYLFKKGLMNPKDFVKVFGDMPQVAEIVYEGNLNQQFIDEVRAGKYPVWEGVVAKGDDFVVKIKTDAYFKKLNEVYGTQYRLYWE
jgi:hypothetical protein